MQERRLKYLSERFAKEHSTIETDLSHSQRDDPRRNFRRRTSCRKQRLLFQRCLKHSPRNRVLCPFATASNRLPKRERTYLSNLQRYLSIKQNCRRRCERSFVIPKPFRRAGYCLPSATKPREGRTKRVSCMNGGAKNPYVSAVFSPPIRLLSPVNIRVKRIQMRTIFRRTNSHRNRQKIRLSKAVFVRFHLLVPLAALYEKRPQLLHVRLSVGQG